MIRDTGRAGPGRAGESLALLLDLNNPDRLGPA